MLPASPPSPSLPFVVIWFQQALVYVHLFAFAIAIAQVIRLDIAWLRTRDLERSGFAAAARTVMTALLVLWVSGLVLIGLTIGIDSHALAESPKLVAKLLVVSVLTINGVALHGLALPRLRRGQPLLAWLLGAVSTTSWSSAALIGAARHIAPALRLSDYLIGYGLALMMAVGCALVLAIRLGNAAAPGRLPPAAA